MQTGSRHVYIMGDWFLMGNTILPLLVMLQVSTRICSLFWSLVVVFQIAVTNMGVIRC